MPQDEKLPDKISEKKLAKSPEKQNKNVAKIRNFEWNRFVVVTILTMLISGVWIAGFVLRLFFHWQVAAAPTLDAAMLLVLGYWFSTAATKDKDKDE